MDSWKSLFVIFMVALTLTTAHGGHGHTHDDHDHGRTENNEPQMKLHYIDLGELGGEESYEIFLRELFRKYGDDDVMTFEGFEHLLQSLGIGRIKINDHDIHDHHIEEGFVALHYDHNHTKVAEDGPLYESPASMSEHTGRGNDSDPIHMDPGARFHRDDHEMHDHERSILGEKIPDHDDVDVPGTKGGLFRNAGEYGIFPQFYIETAPNKAYDSALTLDSDTAELGHDKLADHEHLIDDHEDHFNDDKKGGPLSADTQDIVISGQISNKTSHERDMEDLTFAHHGVDYQGEGSGSVDDTKDTLLIPPEVAELDDDEGVEWAEAGDLMEPHQSQVPHEHQDHDTHRRKRHVNRDIPMAYARKRPAAYPARAVRSIGDMDAELRVPERKCFTPGEILSTVQIESTSGITKEDFRHLCPAIVYQIDLHTCSTEDLVADYLLHNDAESHCRRFHEGRHQRNVSATPLRRWSFTEIPMRVWGLASIAVLVISLVGLVAVAIVPLMQRVFFTQLLQFLVALAVGSLTGDALLHLLPQALAGEGHSDEAEDHAHDLEGTFRGLTVLSGVYFFFVMERLLEFCTAWRKRKLMSKKKQMSIGDSDVSGQRISTREETPMVLYKASDLDVDDVHHPEHDLDFEEDEQGHGHSHGPDAVPASVAALAWMVIMGDGLHNFSDGLAIGAAFANSISGGLSTSVAVFCHELPHELGDFAVLLQSGMSVKQALFYNIVSSVLCFLGMFLGVALGNLQSASLWIFAVAGGMFIYIALVDMLPMITKHSKHKGRHFFLHILGLTLGSGIMLLIAIYEGDIRVSIT